MSLRPIGTTIRAAIPRVRHAATQALLSARIQIKWLQDSRHLPLLPEHWELYQALHSACWRRLRSLPRLVDCVDYNDRIQWLKLFDQHSDIVRCSDKLGVRQYAAERGCDMHLPKLYGIWEHPNDIQFDALPDHFVVKATHDCGSTIVVKNKRDVAQGAIRKRLAAALQVTYGTDTGEWAYSFIRPLIIAEQFIDSPQTTRPPDYKFHMVNGRMAWLQYIFDRGTNTKETIVDACGNAMPIHFDTNMEHVPRFKKPVEWDELHEVAAKLAHGWKYVRVDLYASNGKVFIGEMTFYPYYGTYKGPGQRHLGVGLDFDRTTFRPPVYHRLRRLNNVT